MGVHEGDDAVTLLRNEIDAQSLAEQDCELMKEFIEWVVANENNSRIIPVLYAWYQMVPLIDFDLEHPDEDDLETLLAEANIEAREDWIVALKLFYTAFLCEEKGLECVNIRDIVD